MANICETILRIVCPTNNDADRFLSQLDTWINQSDHMTCASIVKAAGIDIPENYSFNRSEVTSYCAAGNTVYIYIDSAWTPALYCWQLILDKYCPDAWLYYRAYEIGFDIHDTNDPMYAGKFNIDYWGDDTDIEPVDDLGAEDTLAFLQEFLSSDSNNLRKLIDICNTGNYSCCVSMWKPRSLDEWR